MKSLYRSAWEARESADRTRWTLSEVYAGLWRPGTDEVTLASHPDVVRATEAVTAAEAVRDALEAEVGGRVFRVYAAKWDDIRARLAKLEKRAAKLGLTPPRIEIGEREVLRSTVGPSHARVEVTTVMLYVVATGETPKLAGWEFLATIEHGDGRNIVRRVPSFGREIPEATLLRYVHDDGTCDHCRKIRRRTETFVVVNEAGETMRVGRSCLRDFLGGADPKTIAAWGEWLAEVSGGGDLDGDEDFFGGPGGGGVGAPTVEEVLAHSVAVLRTTGFFLAATRARDEGRWHESTAAVVAGNIRNYGKTDRMGHPLWTADVTIEDYAEAARLSEWAKAKFSEDRTVFASNVLAVLGKDDLGRDWGRDVGILAFIPEAARREVETARAKSEAATRSNEHVGRVGERLSLSLTVERVSEHHGDYGLNYLTVLRDEAGNRFKWWGSYEMPEGATVTGKWTVKRHGEYEGRRETVLSRPARDIVIEGGVLAER